MHGERMLSEVRHGRLKYNFNLTGKPEGIYFVRVVAGKNAGTQKVIRY